MIRVFPRRTKWTPADELAFVGDPPLFLPDEQPVMVSVTFTWDIPEGQRLQRAWQAIYAQVELGGPAFGDPGGEFVPGRFIREGVTITSRGCIRNCSFCLVPQREGRIRELQIRDGWIVNDNNLLACSRRHIEAVFDMLRQQNKPIEFPGGIDSRLLEPWHIELFKSIRLGRLFMACDSEAALKPLEWAADLLADFSQNKKHCYVLIGNGNDTMQAAEKRLRRVYELGFLPFAMLFEDWKHKDWKRFQRTWCRPAAYKTLLKSTPPPQTAGE